jgi:hypothetical protein
LKYGRNSREFLDDLRKRREAFRIKEMSGMTNIEIYLYFTTPGSDTQLLFDYFIFLVIFSWIVDEILILLSNSPFGGILQAFQLVLIIKIYLRADQYDVHAKVHPQHHNYKGCEAAIHIRKPREII